jgi:alpha/beta superfamily hydrolase
VAARDRRVRAVFAMGYPLTTIDDDAFLETIAAPRLFVQGARDAFGPEGAVRSRVERLAPPHEVVIVADADHFFDGHLDALQGAVAGWARTRPWARGLEAAGPASP